MGSQAVEFTLDPKLKAQAAEVLDGACLLLSLTPCQKPSDPLRSWQRWYLPRETCHQGSRG